MARSLKYEVHGNVWRGWAAFAVWASGYGGVVGGTAPFDVFQCVRRRIRWRSLGINGLFPLVLGGYRTLIFFLVA